MKKLEMEREKVIQEKVGWKKEQEQINRQNQIAEDQIFELDVSGVTQGFKLNKKLLCSVPNSMLEAKFSGRHPIPKTADGKVYINRDPHIFAQVINFLRNPVKLPILPNQNDQDQLILELEYWGLKQTKDGYLNELYNLFKQEPIYVNAIILSKWNELGPFDLQ